MERFIRGALDDTVSETAESVVGEVGVVLDGEENINGGDYRHEALRKSGDCRGGRNAEVHMLLGSMILCQRLRGMNGGDHVVVKEDYW